MVKGESILHTVETVGVESMPMPAAYLRALLDVFGVSVESRNQLLSGTRIDPTKLPAANEEVRLCQFIALVDNLSSSAPHWALDLKCATYVPVHGSLGVAVRTATTVREAIGVLERYAHLRVPYFRLLAEDHVSRLRLRVARRIASHDQNWHPLLVSLLLSLQALLESSFPLSIRDGAFEFPFPEPPSEGPRYRERFHAPLHFCQPHAGVSLSSVSLEARGPFSDPAEHRAALLDLEATERRFCGREHVVERVLGIVTEFSDRPPTLSKVAQRLRVSERTLARQLREHDVSFRDLVAEYRSRAAKRLLSDPTLSVTEVGFLLGYADPANFCRAFRRWFRQSPLEYRRHTLA